VICPSDAAAAVTAGAAIEMTLAKPEIIIVALTLIEVPPCSNAAT
jgi:hypothetical protein